MTQSFTKKEMYLIERVFDNLLSDNYKGLSQMLNSINAVDDKKIKQEAEEMVTKMLPNNAKFVDTVMTICTKCQEWRESI